MVIKSFRYTIGAAFDNLFSVFILNFIWFLLHCIPLFIYITYDHPDNPVNINIPEIARTDPSLFKFFLVFVLMSIILFNSPFTIAIFRMNKDFSEHRSTGIGTYFSYVGRYFFRSLRLMFFNILIAVIIFVDIWFYQRVFAGNQFLYYLFTMINIMLLSLFAFTALNYLPLMLNGERRLWGGYKLAFRMAFINLLPSLWVLWFFLIMLFFTKTALIPYISIPCFIFIFPVFFGQYIYESYVSAMERLGHEREYKEERVLKDFLFPWRSTKTNDKKK